MISINGNGVSAGNTDAAENGNGLNKRSVLDADRFVKQREHRNKLRRLNTRMLKRGLKVVRANWGSANCRYHIVSVYHSENVDELAVKWGADLTVFLIEC